MVFHRSFSDSKSLQVSRTLLSILVDLNNVAVWMVSTRPLISKYPSPCINPLVTVPRASITIGITVTFRFQIFNSPARSRYLSFFSLFSFLLCGQPGRQSSQFCKFSSFFLLLWILVVRLKLGDPFASQNSRGVRAFHFPGQILGCA